MKKKSNINVISGVSADRMIESVIKESIEQGRPVAMSEIWVSKFRTGVDMATGEDASSSFSFDPFTNTLNVNGNINGAPGANGFATTQTVDPLGIKPTFFSGSVQTRFAPLTQNALAHAFIHGVGES